MIFKIYYNKNVKKVTLKNIKLSKNKKYLLWFFYDSNNKEYRGITSSKIIYGSKAYIWYSLLAGYYLPHSYTVNFDNIIGKECYVAVNYKSMVSFIIPIQNSSVEKDESIFK